MALDSGALCSSFPAGKGRYIVVRANTRDTAAAIVDYARNIGSYNVTFAIPYLRDVDNFAFFVVEELTL